MIVRLETLAAEGCIVRLPRSLARRLKAKGRQVISVRIGQARVKARCSMGSATTVLAMSPALLSRLSLRRGMRLHAQIVPEGLQVGPLVGILVPGTRGGANPIGNMTLGVKYLIEQGKLAGTYPFAFSCRAVNFEKGVVRGYTMAQTEMGLRWVRRTFPLPDVVYDHITYRRRDRAADIRNLRAQLRARSIPYFNPGYFDKWEVHTWLNQVPEFQPHLPETQLLSPETLAEMTSRHQRVFIKPAKGSLGRKIAVVTRLANGAFEMRRGRRAGKRLTVADPAALVDRLPKLAHDFYIVQQGLDLCRFRGRRRDIRVIMQRNASGRWTLSKIFARVAPSGSLVANISAGATGLPAGRSLRRCFSAARVERLLKQIRQLSFRICQHLTATLDGHLGELGIDLGVDTAGRVWIIEVIPNRTGKRTTI